MTRDMSRTRVVGLQMLMTSWIIDSLDGKPVYFWLALCAGLGFIIIGAFQEFSND